MTDSFLTGGSERQFVALAQALKQGRFQIHSGCIQKKGDFLRGFENSVQFPLGGSLYGLASWVMRLRLAQYLRHNRICLAQAFDFYTNVALLPVARMAGVPVVIGSHRQLGDLLGSAKFSAQLLALQFCDRIVCNSRAAARVLTEHGLPDRKVVVIGNGLRPEAFAPAEPIMPKIPGILRVGMISRMNTPAKNHALFLEAAARIASRLPNVEFLLAGDGSLRASLERQVRDLRLGDRVFFLGDCRDIPAVLASIDLSALPSKSESLSNTVLESMAAGVPVIASDVCGNSELLGADRGLLVPPNDSEALAQSIEMALSNSAWRQSISERARRFVSENFRLADVSRRYEELYEELLREKNHQQSVSPISTGKLARLLKVAIVAASSRYVGGQSVQADLLRKFWENDKEVNASFIAIDPPLPRWFGWAANIPGLRTLLRQPIFLRNLWRDLEDADIAHIFSASYWSFLVAPVPAWLVARARGAKVLIHYHSGEAQDHLTRFRTARPALARADKVAVPTGFLVKVFSDFGLRADAIPNVIDLSQFHFRARRPLRPHLICTRGLHPYYCVDVVVRAFAEIQKQCPQARLDLLGTGSTERQIRSLVSELKLRDVRFMGVVSRGEISQYYDQADIFINASRLDNMPVSILEAYASGLPVVSTSPEGMDYVVEDGKTGLLSEVGKPEVLAANVLRLLSDANLASELVNNALTRCEAYAWRTVRQQWLDLYESLVAPGP